MVARQRDETSSQVVLVNMFISLARSRLKHDLISYDEQAGIVNALDSTTPFGELIPNRGKSMAVMIHLAILACLPAHIPYS